MATSKKWLDWIDIDNGIDSIVKELTTVRYDTVLGLARGGMIPATILSYKLKCPNLQQLGVRTRDVESIQYYGNPLLTGNILIVDDINDSGLTFSSVDNYIRYHFDHNEIKSITYCSLYQRYNSKFKTGVYGDVIQNDDWLVFPWD
jgi:hypoxanthine phosphoribosyltransferase